MRFPAAYLSRPCVVLPEEKLDNEEVLRRIRANYKGDPGQWLKIEATVRFVFKSCNSKYRYLEPDDSVRVADYAVRASQACLQASGVAAEELDLLINGGIAREYFEPATAMEVAAKLGVKKIHAFDVTSACVGQLEGVQIACAYFGLHEHINTALVCAAELTRWFLSYEIQSVEEVASKVAGLTIGNAASAWLLRRKPFAGGCMRLLAAENFSLPEHWHLCLVPIDGTFVSFSEELFKLNVCVAPQLQRFLDRLGWSPHDVDHYVFHQPSDLMVKKIITELGADPEKAIKTHSLFANTSSTTVSLAMDQLLKEKKLMNGQKLVLASAAAGFSMVTLAAEWVA